MQQPIPHGATCGMEVHAEFKVDGLRAANVDFKLLCDDKIVQTGVTDKDGLIRNLNVAMYDPSHDIRYTLIMDTDKFDALVTAY